MAWTALPVPPSTLPIANALASRRGSHTERIRRVGGETVIEPPIRTISVTRPGSLFMLDVLSSMAQELLRRFTSNISEELV
jgi:hypothetical protein